MLLKIAITLLLLHNYLMVTIPGIIYGFCVKTFIYNYLAKRGYKLNKATSDYKTLKESMKKHPENVSSRNTNGTTIFNYLINNMDTFYFIPFINILVPSALLLKIVDNGEKELMRRLIATDQVVPLSEEERKLYEKKKNFITAYRINSHNLFPNTHKKNNNITYFKDGVKNLFVYDILDKNYVITKTEGPISNFSDIEKRSIFIKLICFLAKSKMDSSNTTKDTMDNTNEDLLNYGTNIDEMKSLTPIEKKQLLYWYRNFLLNFDKDSSKEDESELMNVLVKEK